MSKLVRGFSLILLLAALAAVVGGDDYYGAEGGPKLEVSSVDAWLESGREGTVWIELENVGQITEVSQKSDPETEDEEMLAMLEREMETEATEAVGIEARLASEDERIEVLSGTQLGGSIQSGQKLDRPLEFLVRVDEDAGAGVYPMTLVVVYERQKNVEVRGNPLYPEIYFQRVAARESLPLEVPVIVGPRVRVEKVEGSFTPGRESTLKLTLANEGDEPALELRAELFSEPLFEVGGKALEMGNLSPDGSVATEFPVRVAREADPGDYALTCQVRYRSGQVEREEDLSVLVEVKRPNGLKAILMLPVLVVLLVALYLGATKSLPRIKRRRRW